MHPLKIVFLTMVWSVAVSHQAPVENNKATFAERFGRTFDSMENWMSAQSDVHSKDLHIQATVQQARARMATIRTEFQNIVDRMADPANRTPEIIAAAVSRLQAMLREVDDIRRPLETALRNERLGLTAVETTTMEPTSSEHQFRITTCPVEHDRTWCIVHPEIGIVREIKLADLSLPGLSSPEYKIAQCLTPLADAYTPIRWCISHPTYGTISHFTVGSKQ